MNPAAPKKPKCHFKYTGGRYMMAVCLANTHGLTMHLSGKLCNLWNKFTVNKDLRAVLGEMNRRHDLISEIE